MLNITINLDAGTARLATASAIKAGAAVPVRLTFDTNPGASLDAASLALSAQSSAPEVLAYLDVFVAQSALVYTGTLNTNDVRLMAHLAGKQAQTLDCELALDFAGSDRQVLPNFPVTVQQPIVTGPEATEGGPVWLDQTAGDARYVRPGEAAEKITLESPDGGVWEITITNDGQLERTKL